MTRIIELAPWIVAAPYLGALAGGWVVRRHAWTLACAGAGFALVAALAFALLPWLSPQGGGGPPDAAGAVVSVLVAFLGWVIVRYSRRYLEGEPGQLRYVRALAATLGFVLVVVLTRNLAVLLAAWFASSLSLHHLLTFYRERPQAQIAAHKKFLVSRAAELCLVAAFALLLAGAGTLDIPGLSARIAASGELPDGLVIAAVLVALAVVLKSAQLPLHGWLIQVMEAPTPVSALLHAGVVNIGGFVLIRLAEVIAAAPPAQFLLVFVGSVTAVLASLVMMTRISIKVRLAWSTCAQMGFMLMQCGLGLYELALLHLVAHSLYKSYAFLNAGDTVYEARRRDLAVLPAGTQPRRSALPRLLAVPATALLVAASTMAWSALAPGFDLPAVALLIATLGVAPLLWESPGGPSWRQSALGVAAVAAVVQLYFLWHGAFTGLFAPVEPPSGILVGWVAACFAGLYALQAYVVGRPASRLSEVLHRWAYAGFYLDEWFTRFAVRAWPPRDAAIPFVAASRVHPMCREEQA